MKKAVGFFILQLLPFWVASSANKKIAARNKDIKLPVVEGNIEIDKIDISLLAKELENNISSKSILEDKLKQNIASITIASTLIVGLLAILGSSYPHLKIGYLSWVIYALSFFTLLYMTIAGYISISTLAAENIIHRPLIEDSSLSEHDLKSKYYLSNKLNIDLNIKRNNYLYASYICIRNALILLIILFGIIAFPINSISYTEKNKVLSTGSFLYSENSTSFINKNTNFSQFENDLKANIDLVS